MCKGKKGDVVADKEGISQNNENEGDMHASGEDVQAVKTWI